MHVDIDIDLGEPLSADIEPEFQKSVLEQIYYLSPSLVSAVFQPGKLLVQLSDETTKTALTEQIREVVLKTKKSLFKFAQKIAFAHHPKGPLSQVDPHGFLRSRRELLAHSDGNFVFQGRILKLMQAIDQFFRNFALSLEAIEQEYPTTIPLDSAVECGYVSGFPHHVGFVSNVEKDFAAITSLTKLKSNSVQSDFKRIVDSPRAILAPTVCYHCFQSLKGQPLQNDFEIFTAKNKCHRNEDKLVVGLERLNTFNMREIIYLGSREKVERTQQKIFLFVTETLVDWNMQTRIVGANDPFFASAAANKRVYQNLYDLKQEIQVFLPYKQNWLAVGSINNHLETLTKGFMISKSLTQSEPGAFSGCVGFGIERIALGVMAQFGLEPSNWPAALR